MLKKSWSRYQKFEHFLSTYCFNKRERFPPTEIEKQTKDIDVFLVGSDWVWHLSDNLLNSDPIDLNWLQFIYLGFHPVFHNKKLIAYAASQGIIPHSPSSILREALENFCMISVREAESVLYLSKNGTTKPIEHVLDPTLLINIADLPEIESNITINNSDKYIFLYILPAKNINTIRVYAQNIAEKTGKSICNFSQETDFSVSGIPSLGNKFGPSEFLAGIKQCHYVITNSFHGMVFALLYHKPFTVFQRQQNDFRQINLVRLLDLENRLLPNIEINHSFEDPYNIKIDWNHVDKLRKKASSVSVDFLKRSILGGHSTY